MKIFVLLSLMIFVLFANSVLYASDDDSLSNGEKIMMEEPFLNITEKVIVFLKQNPTKNNLTLEGLLREKVINKEDYEFLIKNNIKYNPPASAGPYDNYISIFDRENENCTSSHILYDLVDRSDPSITKAGNLADLSRFVSEWFEHKSDKKSMSLFKDENFYYFSLCYWDNDYWDKQHIMLIDFPESHQKDIDKFKALINAHNITYKENSYQNALSLTVLLPPELSIIEALSRNILVDIFKLSDKDVMNFTPDGFRFKY